MDDMQPGRRLAAAVRQHAADLDLTQEQLATRCGLSTPTIKVIVAAGRNSYQPRTLKRLDAGLGWPPGYARAVMDGLDPMERRIYTVLAEAFSPAYAQEQVDAYRRQQEQGQPGDRHEAA